MNGCYNNAIDCRLCKLHAKRRTSFAVQKTMCQCVHILILIVCVSMMFCQATGSSLSMTFCKSSQTIARCWLYFDASEISHGCGQACRSVSEGRDSPYLGVVSTTKPLMQVKGTLGVFAVLPFALSASAVSFLGWPVHGTFHDVATPRTLHQSKACVLP